MFYIKNHFQIYFLMWSFTILKAKTAETIICYHLSSLLIIANNGDLIIQELAVRSEVYN